jgi:uncharacterized protein (DUF433 family)
VRSRLAAGRRRRYADHVLALNPSPLPLKADADGSVRVAGTRVLLELIVAAFDEGATPEQIVQEYTTVPLEATYAVIAWILEHRAEVDRYMADRLATGAVLRAEIEPAHPLEDIRARLLARRTRT